MDKHSVSSNDTSTRTAPAWAPETDAERNAIREQLERLVASPLFNKSKRLPSLLRFVVERSLQGQVESLKERTLGVEVFARAPNYDTNSDPVVRTTAVEIRKRIAQYYHEPGHESEIRIDFPPGSYVAEFRLPPEPPVTVLTARVGSRWSMLGIVTLLTAIVLAVVLLWTRSPQPRPATDLFWAPILNSPDPVGVYIGGFPIDRDVTNLLDLQNSERVAFADATALARVISLLETHHRLYRIRFQLASKLEDLKDGPAVLIGAFNNSFTLRFTGQLRFSFVRNPETRVNYIQDRNDAQNRKWSVDMTAPHASVKEDYAIVSRIVDPVTGRVVVMAAGLAKFGTQAAGEFITDPNQLQQIAKMGPKDWDRKNMEVVIATDPIGRTAGVPRAIAAHFW